MDKVLCDLNHIVLKATRRLRRVNSGFLLQFIFMFYFSRILFFICNWSCRIATAQLLYSNYFIFYFVKHFYSQQFEQVIISCSSNKLLETFSSHRRQLRVIIYLLQFLAIQLSQIAGIETLDTIAVLLHDIHFFFIIYLPTFHEDQ